MVSARLILASVTAALTALVVVAGCRSSAERARLEERATAEAETRARAIGTTTITSAAFGDEADAEPGDDARDAADAAFRAEQDDYRVRLRDALELVEARGRAAPPTGRRAVLIRDLEVLERSTAATWATVRATIEGDLRRSSSPHDGLE